MKVVAFNGSARENANTAILLDHVLGELRGAGVETELIQLASKRVAGCKSCSRCQQTKDMTCSADGDVVNEYIEKMVAADGIILGSPVYFAEVSASLKSLVGRAGQVAHANGQALRRKVGAVVIQSTFRRASTRAFDSFYEFLQDNEMVIAGSVYLHLGFGREIGDLSNDDEGIQTARTLGRNMAWVIEKLHG